jgi:16S rRNA processing protein RimM
MTVPLPSSAARDPIGSKSPVADRAEETSYIAIGRIIKPVGLSGEVKVLLLTDFPERFQSLGQVHVTTVAGNRVCRVSAARQVGPLVYLRFSGVDCVEQADLLRGGLIQIPEKERLSLPEGSYYQYEIIGLDVFTEAGERLGQVGDILKTGSNDVYVVRGKAKGEYYIPALTMVVQKIDLIARQMVIRPIPGLLEVNTPKNVRQTAERAEDPVGQ